MPDSLFVDLYAGLWARLFGLERYARKSSPGQMSLFGDEAPAGGQHDVSQEPRDAKGEWTAGAAATKKTEESAKPDVVPAADVATLRQDETKPVLGEKPMNAGGREWIIDNLMVNDIKGPRVERIGGFKHLFAKIQPKNKPGRGFFLLGDGDGVLDRKAYREIAAEAKQNGIETPYHIYGKIATYQGPGMYFMNPPLPGRNRDGDVTDEGPSA